MPTEAIKAVAEAPAETIKAVTDLIETVGVNDSVKLGVSMTRRGVDAGSKAVAKKSEERSTLVEVPEMYSSDYRLKLEDAKRWLEEDGFRPEAVVVQPNIIYKDCAEFEVVATNYKLGKKVKPGTRIILRYVTSEVIATSQEMFIESEKHKAETEREKAENQAVRAEIRAGHAVKNKQNLDKTVATVQHGLNDAIASTQKGVKGLLSNISRKKKNSNKESDNEN